MRKNSVKEGGAVVAFHRWEENQNFVVVVNLSPEPVNAVVDLSSVFKGTDLEPDQQFSKEDLVTYYRQKKAEDPGHFYRMLK